MLEKCICNYCHKEYEVIFSRKNFTKFCSHSCKANFRVGKLHPRYGKKHSKETKEKLSKILKGKIPWIKGKKHSKETVKKLRKSHLGYKVLESTKKKISKTMKGNLLIRQENSHNWKGNNIGRMGIHMWLKKIFIKERCEFCGKPYKKVNNRENLDWAKKTECKYERKRENFIVLCRSCHIKYDKHSL